MKYTVLLCSLLAPTAVVHASPTGASACTGGGPAVGGPHLSDSAVTGALSDGTISFAINNAVLDPSFSEFAIQTGAPLTLLVSAGAFRGALIRVSSTTSYTLTPGVNGQSADSVCTDDGVFGVTHTSNNDKTELAAELTIDDVPAGERVTLDIDVTVVVTSNPSVYYHNTFTVTAGRALPNTPTSPVVTLPASPSSPFNGTDPPAVAPGTTQTPVAGGVTTAPVAVDGTVTTAPVAVDGAVTTAPVAVDGAVTTAPVAVDGTVTTTPVAANGTVTASPANPGTAAFPTASPMNMTTDGPNMTNAQPSAVPPTASPPSPVQGPTVTPPTSAAPRTVVTVWAMTVWAMASSLV